MISAAPATVYFAIPGDIQTLTGGYGYDRRLIAGLDQLGMQVARLQLSGLFPMPDAAAVADADARFNALPDGAIVLADGLAYGAMDQIAEQHGKRLRIIALCHHPLALEAGLSQEQSQKLHDSEKRALDAAVAVVVTSAATATLLNQQFAIPDSKITVAQPGTDRQPFAACSGNPPRLLTVATLTPRKAHDVLIDALAQIRHLPWVARFVGGSEFDPEWASQLQEKANAYRFGKRIELVGALSDLSGEYASADAFVLPSLFEGYGMVFAEALSFGLPIVAARAGAVPDVVPESAGMLVPPGDVDALADTLATLLKDMPLRNRLQHGAQQAAVKLPEWNDTAAIVANLIQEVRNR
ncbi:MAG: glycosyltransferase family 4 protein [Gammaproteobacteria bacterium]|nr:glycosyltransferase family 4 protein [Gammaproteobacteria bacterium]MDP2346392.1 glycosyltransferase family 4 protein [Gammaproteobacteria bacterium]